MPSPAFSCALCRRQTPVDTPAFRCGCGGPFRLDFSPGVLPLSSLPRRGNSIWRYREMLPIEEDRSIVTLGEGGTPLVPFSSPGFSRISLKLDYLGPTGSYKDRGVSVLVSKLKELGISRCVEDSSGNAGSSLAAYAARAGIACRIFCPADTSEGKLVQIKAYGAGLVKVPGSRADTARAIQEEARRVYYASHNWNPFFLEGIKTLAYEIVEQMDWQPPDAILSPVGYGSLQLGLYQGLRELKEQGIIDRLPRLIGVQAEAVSPIYQALSRDGSAIDEVPSRATLGEGIACTLPVRGPEILAATRLTGGTFAAVTEEEILEGWRELNRQGVYVEPTSAVVVRAVDRLARRGLLNRDEKIVLVLTGSGLKATDKMARYVETA